MKQKSEQWFNERRPVTGSRIGGILNLSPWSNEDSVLREVVRQHHKAESEFKGNIATQWGEDHEQDGINWYESQSGNLVEEHGLSVHPDFDWISYSADGIVNGKILVEVKAPYSQKIPEEVPMHYWAQVQLGMEVLGLESCDFIYWSPDVQRLFVVVRDEAWFEQVLPKLQDFYERYLKELDNPKHLEDRKVTIETEEWAMAANEYIEAKASLAVAQEREKAAKERLVSLAGERSAQGAGVSLSRVEREGSLRYSKFIKDQGLSVPDSYRGKPSVFYKVTVN
jgi:putative phage-type endonuclease